MALAPHAPQMTRTKGLSPLMELPVELRLKIYPHLLISDADLIIDSKQGSKTTPSPSVAILQTCKRINEEATPILYGKNRFIIHLSMDPVPAYALTKFFLLNSLRWTSITALTSISFVSHSTSNSSGLLGLDAIFSESTRTQPAFNCTGADIIARFTTHDFRYSPKGPDDVMALSISNWISIQVMKAMLSAFQREVEESMRTSFLPGAGGADDAAAGNGDADE